MSPSLFLSVKETSAIAGKGYEYERLQVVISLRFKLRAILIETLLLTQKALKNVHMLLVL
jgi:hypothetical protein